MEKCDLLIFLFQSVIKKSPEKNLVLKKIQSEAFAQNKNKCIRKRITSLGYAQIRVASPIVKYFEQNETVVNSKSKRGDLFLIFFHISNFSNRSKMQILVKIGGSS